MQRLFFLNGDQDLSSFLLVDIGKVKYPEYKCNRKMPVFPTREGLLEYEKVLDVCSISVNICPYSVEYFDERIHVNPFKSCL